MTHLLSLLIPALIVCESGGIDNYYNAYTGAAGCLQITGERLDDVNAILQIQAQAQDKQAHLYTLDDRFDRCKAHEMAYKFLYYAGNAYRLDNSGKYPDMETLTRIWKGGMKGYADIATIPYWKRVQAALDEQEQRRKHNGALTRPGRIIKTYSPLQGERHFITPCTN